MFQHVIEIPQTQEDHPIWNQQLRGGNLLPYQHESGGTKFKPGKPDRVLYSFHSE